MKYGFVMLLFACSSVAAQNSALNLQIPSTPGSYLSDRFRSGELDCSMGIGSGTSFEFGVVGIINKGTISANPTQNQGDVGVYGRITIPIGAPKERINCNSLYQLELRKKQLEVEKLERELKNLKELKFENTTK